MVGSHNDIDDNIFIRNMDRSLACKRQLLQSVSLDKILELVDRHGERGISVELDEYKAMVIPWSKLLFPYALDRSFSDILDHFQFSSAQNKSFFRDLHYKCDESKHGSGWTAWLIWDSLSKENIRYFDKFRKYANNLNDKDAVSIPLVCAILTTNLIT